MSTLFPGSPTATFDGASLPPSRGLASLWRRSLAFVVDSIIVGVAANLIALPFFEPLSRLGAWGPVIGFLFALPYFAILNSGIANGQTLGKRLLHIQVVDIHGNPVPFLKSLLRYLVFAGPYYLDSIPLSLTHTPPIVPHLISAVFGGAAAATFYLVVFNRSTRQGLHDLAAGSYVADADVIGLLQVKPVWRRHYAIVGAVLVCLWVGGYFVGERLRGSYPQLLADVQAIESMPQVQHAGVNDLVWTNFDGQKKKILIVNALWSGKSSAEESFSNELAKTILQKDPQVTQQDLLRIVLIRGYDLGVAKSEVAHTFEHTPAEWNSLLFGIPQKNDAAQ